MCDPLSAFSVASTALVGPTPANHTALKLGTLRWVRLRPIRALLDFLPVPSGSPKSLNRPNHLCSLVRSSPAPSPHHIAPPTSSSVHLAHNELEYTQSIQVSHYSRSIPTSYPCPASWARSSPLLPPVAPAPTQKLESIARS